MGGERVMSQLHVASRTTVKGRWGGGRNGMGGEGGSILEHL